MVCRRKKKATVSAIRQPTSFNFDCWASSQSCFFATTTFAFDKGSRSFSAANYFLLLNLGGVRCLSASALRETKIRPAYKICIPGSDRSGWASLNPHFSRRGHPELAKDLARGVYDPHDDCGPREILRD